MSEIKINGKYVAIPQLSLEKEEKPKVRGIDFSAAFTKDLIKSPVLFTSDRFKKGQLVYLRADSVMAPQNKVVLTIGTTKFVLLPEEHVVAEEEN
jgi:hypothetical protein